MQKKVSQGNGSCVEKSLVPVMASASTTSTSSTQSGSTTTSLTPLSPTIHPYVPAHILSHSYCVHRRLSHSHLLQRLLEWASLAILFLHWTDGPSLAKRWYASFSICPTLTSLSLSFSIFHTFPFFPRLPVFLNTLLHFQHFLKIFLTPICKRENSSIFTIP